MNSNDNVIFTGYNAKSFLYLFPFILKSIRVNIFFWDTVERLPDYKKIFPVIKKSRAYLSSYDHVEARKLGIRFVPQQYNFRNHALTGGDNCIRYDLYFMISIFDDVRKQLIDTVLEKIKKLDISSNILLIDNVKHVWITYKQNIENVKQARCLLEINKPGQYGLTMRVMESLALKKKLITNNVAVKYYPFYNSNNIFILGEDNESDLESFICSDYVDVDEQSYMQFDVTKWIEGINNYEKNYDFFPDSF